jgi:DNA-binding CsgD family transcriptional regulator
MINFDPDLNSYKDGLINLDEIANINTLNNDFFYILDLSTQTIIHVSDNFKNLTGYDSDKLTFPFFYKITHRKDRNIVCNATHQILCKYLESKNKNLEDYLFCIDFKIKKKNNTYIRVLKRSRVFKQDNLGNILFTISFFTDITDSKKTDIIEAYIFNTKTNNSTILNFKHLDKKCNGLFTTKQMQILQRLSIGKHSLEISVELGLSYHTICSHRKNMLEKSNTKNTYDLLIFAKERGYI